MSIRRSGGISAALALSDVSFGSIATHSVRFNVRAISAVPQKLT
jgi:hypothetical protein